MFKKNNRILIANRGEIALRVIKSCKKLGIETVLAVSEIDRGSYPAQVADFTVCIGGSPANKSYLNVNAIMMAAKYYNVDAIHPGYGFLAEQAKFFELCYQNEIEVIGPKSEHIAKMGDKLTARSIVSEIGVPVIPGSELVSNYHEAETVMEYVGYPALLKAAAGGGGKGMKIVQEPKKLQNMFTEASAEAQSAFGDKRIYIEHYIPNARHIEIQVLCDKYGNAIHLYERDCSLQRRYQKMIEEAPCNIIDDNTRNQICNEALRIIRHISYESAGTVEFIYDQDNDKYYFLEMNTRIQVEHPITEFITDVDLVSEQIKIANNEKISYNQNQISINGHSIECRINAEDPKNKFHPTPGKIIRWKHPQGDGIRVDSHCFNGYFIPPYYDSLIAKLIVHDTNRQSAIEKMKYALKHFEISGVETTIPFYQQIMNTSDYLRSDINTKWIENYVSQEGE